MHIILCLNGLQMEDLDIYQYYIILCMDKPASTIHFHIILFQILFGVTIVVYFIKMLSGPFNY
jgi:hypothetical protein